MQIDKSDFYIQRERVGERDEHKTRTVIHLPDRLGIPSRTLNLDVGTDGAGAAAVETLLDWLRELRVVP